MARFSTDRLWTHRKARERHRHLLPACVASSLRPKMQRGMQSKAFDELLCELTSRVMDHEVSVFKFVII